MKASIVFIMIATISISCTAQKKQPLQTLTTDTVINTSEKLPYASSNFILTGIITDQSTGEQLIGVNIVVVGTSIGTISDIDGSYSITVPNNKSVLEISYAGYITQRLAVRSAKSPFNIMLSAGGQLLDEVVVTGYSTSPLKKIGRIFKKKNRNKSSNQLQQNNYQSVTHQELKPHHPRHHDGLRDRTLIDYNSEQYGKLVENKFINPIDEALSTFSIDVDRASYSNMRRFVESGSLPPKDAIRVEEMINYFNYDYPTPKSEDPLAMHTTLTDCPWNKNHQILHIGLQGKKIATKDLPASNLVFLVDVSGSMNSANKLPLLKSSFKMLLNNLRPEDMVAIVTYSGRAGLALESTSAKEKGKILSAIESLGAGGSTAGAEGIKTAYNIARANFIKGGNNRIILATDGDFNVGIHSNDDLQDLIEKERKSGVFLSVLGYGMGNYKDEQMQTLANKGNGNHAYIDNIMEARKVLVNEFGGTLFTIAKDVKLQLEFNPAFVSAYRLIGYENRLLGKEDFNNDKKDAGELGAGHVVTAMYEIVMTGSDSDYIGSVDDLKYQANKKVAKMNGDELATIKFRYKKPDEDISKKIVQTIDAKINTSPNSDIRFSQAVAAFGMYLRDSDYLKDRSLDAVISLADQSRGADKEGYRAEFIRMVKSVNEITSVVTKK